MDVQDVQFPIVCFDMSVDELLALRFLAKIICRGKDLALSVCLLLYIFLDMLSVLLLARLVGNRQICALQS